MKNLSAYLRIHGNPDARLLSADKDLVSAGRILSKIGKLLTTTTCPSSVSKEYDPFYETIKSQLNLAKFLIILAEKKQNSHANDFIKFLMSGKIKSKNNSKKSSRKSVGI